MEKENVVHVAPSHFVRVTEIYRSWTSVTICEGCGRRAKQEDQVVSEPCPGCGGREIVETVGRWVEYPTSRMRRLFQYAPGYWELIEETDDKRKD